MNKFILFTNAKCGGTTIKHWFFADNKLKETILSPTRFYRHFGVKVASRSYLNLKHKLTQYENDRSDKNVRELSTQYRKFVTNLNELPCSPKQRKFLLARNPYERVISAFIDKFCTTERNKTWVQEVYFECSSEEITFIEFLKYLKRTPFAELNEHWRPQTHIIADNRSLTILKLETLKDDFNKHSELWGDRDPEILNKKTQSNNYSPSSTGENFARMNTSQLMRYSKNKNSFPKKTAFLTEEAITLINEIYRNDLLELKYSTMGNK